MYVPSKEDVAKVLAFKQAFIGDDFVDGEGNIGMDVRLQVHSGMWSILTGDSSYDQDHRGCWGSGWLSRETDCNELAADLIGQVEEDAAMRGVEEEDN